MKRFLTSFIVFMLAGGGVYGQGRVISGKVIDERGSAVSGASIIVKGTNRGTSADASGDFSISAKTGDVLQVTAANFGTSEAKVGTLDDVTVTLKPGENILEEVVVTALGIKREKRSLTYASETINSDQINNSGRGNPLSELAGKAAGLTVINSSGDPGSGTYIRLRGVTSITGDNQPLMVVDGVPIDNSINNYDPTAATPNTSGANANLTGGTVPSNRGIDINPNDIESITVLKGPAATALYGIRAASGALIITTKKGNYGSQRTSIQLNSSLGFDRYNKVPELQTSYSQGNAGAYLAPFSANGNRRVAWGALIDTLYWDGNSNEWDVNGNVVGQSDPAAKIPVSAYNRYNFFETGLSTNNNIAITGGSDKTSFRVSLGNLYQKGIVPLSKYNKTTFGIGGQAKVSDKLSVSGGLNFIVSSNHKVQQGSNTSGIMLGLLRTPPTFDNSNGLSDPANNPASYINASTQQQRSYRGGIGYDNPYWTVNRNPFVEDVNRQFGHLQASYKLADWITIAYRLGGDVYSQDSKNFYDVGSAAFTAGKGIISDYFNNQYNSDLTLSFQKSFGDKLSGGLLLGHNYFYNKSKSRLTIGDGLITPTFFDIVNALSYSASELEGEKRTAAVYGQAELSYDNMLFLNVTGRRETSSSLPEDNRNFFYPSAGLGFVFTQLPGFKNNNSLLSFGKLRLSYAQVGKDAPIQGLQTYYGSTTLSDGFTAGILFPVSFNGVPTGAYQITSPVSVIGNPDLRPEKTSSYEVGLDLGILQNRVNLSATYYYSKTTDAIFTVPYAYSTGFASKLQNAGELTNEGIELSLNTTPVKGKNFSWDLNLNFSSNKNVVTKLFDGVQKILIAGFTGGEIDAFAGEAFGQIYGGLYQRANPGTGSKGLTSGDLLINDVAGDPAFGKPIVSAQNAILGNVNPKWLGTVTNTLTFKSLSLGFQVDIRHGGQIWNGTLGALSYFGTSKETENRGSTAVFEGLLGHLNADGEVVHYAADGVTEIPGSGAANTAATAYDQYYWQNIGSSFIGPSEQSVEDASFVKLRQVSLTVGLPKSIFRSAFQNASFTIFANNIILSTNYSGVDPETSLAGPANGQGLDYFNNPGIKSFGARLNIGL